MYKTIIFDLDDTLTDDKANIKETLKIVMKYMNIKYTENNFKRFYEIDKATWRDRAAGKLLTPYEDNKEKKTEWIRASRFLKFFNNEISYEEAVEVNNIYMDGMKKHVVSRDGTKEVINYLHEKEYKIIIATNGPTIPLKTKIDKLGITNYVDTIFAADEVGFMKPHKKYYEGLLKKSNITNKSDILFIGDDLDKDIKGGLDNGIDTCWCNYNNEINNKYNTQYEITSLYELKNIL